MKTVIALAGAFLLGAVALRAESNADYADVVNPLIGTDSTHGFSHGNTYPAVAAPFGMTFWTPRTGDASGWVYQYGAKRLRALQATHQPSPWMGDYGNFGVMPFVGESTSELPTSAFSHDDETSKPHLYAVTLKDSGVRAEMTATTRSAAMRFAFPRGKRAWIHFDAYSPGDFVIDKAAGVLQGVARKNNGGVTGDFGCRFVAEFSAPIKSVNASPDNHWVAVEGAARWIGRIVIDAGERECVAVGDSHMSA